MSSEESTVRDFFGKVVMCNAGVVAIVAGAEVEGRHVFICGDLTETPAAVGSALERATRGGGSLREPRGLHESASKLEVYALWEAIQRSINFFWSLGPFFYPLYRVTRVVVDLGFVSIKVVSSADPTGRQGSYREGVHTHVTISKWTIELPPRSRAAAGARSRRAVPQFFRRR